ncbi:MAG: carbohydrate-binding family 9-like protein [Bacteroidales bacterium]|nr:carbohydrate-binding family 9-like protein [Bacteroidales bacterium]
MIVPKINLASNSAEQAAKEINENKFGLTAQKIGFVNWPDEFPYAPSVFVKIAHTDKDIVLQFDVEEQYTMAHVKEDNGEVWTDSCCEFFISFDDSGYYNLEMTCIGKALLGFRKTKPNAVHGDKETMESIKRFSTLGSETFDERIGENKWQLTAILPLKAFFKHNITSFDNLKAKINVYKCGDNLTKPHFLSLFPIDSESPNFHLPEFFKEVEFEK